MKKFDLFDGHCDTLFRCWDRGGRHFNGGSLRENSGHIDLLRARAATGRYCQFFAIFGSPSVTGRELSCPQVFDAQYALFRRELEENADLAVHCRTAAEAERAHAQGKIAAFLSVEGGELLDCDLDRLEDAYEKGVRAVNLTWNHANALSGSSREETGRGLSEQGRAFVRRMHRLGMLVDVSHLSDPGFWDVAELAEEAGKPMFASHSCARALWPHERNLTDEQFAAMIRTRGVCGINLCGEFLGERPTVDTLAGHVDHWMGLGGGASIAIGGDWDGCSLVPGIGDLAGLGQLYERLLRMNYKEEAVHAIFYDNMMRVVREICTM